ncbi:uncharacterized protein [Nicotiana tomentosiformis]|uniref:uncharacterized protein n=1 Tax=Nicotiana tomentosiformis TaxID=4098 RepID=UPI00388CD81B
MTRERVSGASFDEVVHIARQIEMVRRKERGDREAKRPRGPGDFIGRGRPYMHAQTGRPVHRGASSGHENIAIIRSPPPFAGRGYFKCGDMGHIKRYCTRLTRGPAQQRIQPTTPTPVTLPLAQPARGGAQSVRGRPRGGGRSDGSQARLYVIPARPDVVASNAMITSIISVFHREASVRFDPGSTYSYVSSYFTHHLDMPRESLVSYVHVSTPVGDTIIVDRVYPSCVVTIGSLDTKVDLLLLSMVDFDMILGMD